MKIHDTDISGLIITTPEVFADERGSFREVFTKNKFLEATGIEFEVLQHNISISRKDVLRGLHFQWNTPLSKLIRCTGGRAVMYALDMRKKSKTFGKVFHGEFGPGEERMLYAPFGMGTGFLVLEDDTKIEYFYDAYYNKEGESNISMFDPELNLPGISLTATYGMSHRDREAQTFKEWNLHPNSAFFDF